MNASQMKYLFSQLDSIECDLSRKIDSTYADYPKLGGLQFQEVFSLNVTPYREN